MNSFIEAKDEYKWKDEFLASPATEEILESIFSDIDKKIAEKYRLWSYNVPEHININAFGLVITDYVRLSLLIRKFSTRVNEKHRRIIIDFSNYYYTESTFVEAQFVELLENLENLETRDTGTKISVSIPVPENLDRDDCCILMDEFLETSTYAGKATVMGQIDNMVIEVITI